MRKDLYAPLTVYVYAQMISTLRLFSSRAPDLIRSLFGIASTVDGFSLDNVVIQCAVKIPLWNQVAAYMLMPFAAVIVPSIIVFLLFHIRKFAGKVCKSICSPSTRTSYRSLVN